VGERFSVPIQTVPQAHPASYTRGTGSILGVKRPGRGVEHPPPSSAEVKERCNLCFRSWQHLLDFPKTSTSSKMVIQHRLISRVRNCFAVPPIVLFCVLETSHGLQHRRTIPDFVLCGRLKQSTYRKRPHTKQELKRDIRD
jgi:hypothetical protein